MNKKGENASKEAHAYTPGLKVKQATTVRKIRRLPIPGEVDVKVGDKVDYNKIVARTMISGDPEIINVATLFNLDPDDVIEYMTKKEGDKVSKGEIIASLTALFGLIKKRATSPIDGTVETISETTGQVFLRSEPVPLNLNAYIPGKVVDVLPKEGAVIETNAAFIQGILGIGHETHGKIKFAVGSPEEILTKEKISPDDKGTVLIGGSLVTLESLKKGVDVGVSCIVAGGIKHTDLKTFMGEELGVAITGEEELGLTLIITEGFGKINIAQRTFDILKYFEGYVASVNGATQIRAGVMRPEIIIPHEDSFETDLGDKLASGMIPGTTVRIIREPYFGAIGKVKNLPIELQQLESRSHVRVVEIELENGRVVTVPRANVEIVEE